MPWDHTFPEQAVQTINFRTYLSRLLGLLTFDPRLSCGLRASTVRSGPRVLTSNCARMFSRLMLARSSCFRMPALQMRRSTYMHTDGLNSTPMLDREGQE